LIFHKRILMNLQCIQCNGAIVLPLDLKTFSCPSCSTAYKGRPNYLRCENHERLLARYGEKYLRNKVLNNNADLVYSRVSGGSLSTDDREDVRAFSRFVAMHARAGVVLDVGCGPLRLPAYLRRLKEAGSEIIGLDPMDLSDFDGFRIVGNSEYIPLPSRSVDTIIFATSLDHVVDLEATIKEAKRVVTENGVVIVWMGDQSRPWWRRLGSSFKILWKSLRAGYLLHRYRIYPPEVVVYVPSWAVDAFHSFHESPRYVIRVMERHGLHLSVYDYRARDQVFISFKAA
jgi:SAM-dependent methyltransferase